MNFSAIQPEPRIPQRIAGASLADLIRDGGSDFGNDMSVASCVDSTSGGSQSMRSRPLAGRANFASNLGLSAEASSHRRYAFGKVNQADDSPTPVKR